MTRPKNHYRDQPVMVTGGAGFIGSALVRHLCAQGARIVVVDNLVNGKRENLADLDPGHVRLVEIDIRERDTMRTILPNVKTVFHLACLGVRHSLHDPTENHSVNATATLHLLAEARRANVERFVHVSTSEVYGDARTVPMNEDHPLQPNTVYGAAKLAGEAYARAAYLTHRFPVTIIRPFNTYGPRSHHEGDSGEVIPKFLLRALAGKPLLVFGDGKQTRDFSYVDDIAHGIAVAGKSSRCLGRTINLGSGKEISINALAQLIGKVVGGEIKIERHPVRPGDTRRLIADIESARRLLSYQPNVDLAEGLQRLLAWYHGQKLSPTELLAAESEFAWQPESK
ncbi:MAG TPA: SDR family NAD(P)-dependent oxidoreductase [bacterium]|nr:SDR family NAD(P)-dependent oxidoreductase [bacterium]